MKVLYSVHTHKHFIQDIMHSYLRSPMDPVRVSHVKIKNRVSNNLRNDFKSSPWRRKLAK